MANQSSGRKWHAGRWAIAAGILAAIVLIIIFVLPALIDVNTYRGRIEAELQSRLGRRVELGNMRLSIVPLAFRVDKATIAEDPGFRTGRPFATADQLQVSAELWPLLHKQVKIKSLTLTRPVVELVRNEQGVWNFASLGEQPASAVPPQAPAGKQPQKPAQPPVQQPAPQAPPQQEKFTLSDLAINDGQLAITDLQKRQPRTVYDHIDLDASDFAQDKAFPLTLAVHLPGAGKQLVELDGTIGPLNLDSPAATPFDGELKMEEASIAAVQQFLNSPALAGTDAVVTGKAQLKSSAGQMGSSGKLELKQARIRNVDLGYPVSLDYAVADNLNTNLLQIAKADLRLGATPISIAGTMNLQPTPSQIDLQVKAGNIGIQEVARLASAFGVAFNPGANIDGKLNADLSAKGPANGPALNGTINASNLVISGKQLPQEVKVPQVQLTLTPQQIQSNDFTAATGGTTVMARFALSRYTTPSPAIDASVRTVNGKLNEVLAIAKAYGITAAEGMEGSGDINLDARAAGPMKDLNAMTFSGTGALRNASLKMPSLAKPLTIHRTDATFTKNGAVLSNFSGSLGATTANGQLTLSNFSAPVVQFTLAADKMVVSEWQQMIVEQPAMKAEAAPSFDLVPRAHAAPAPAPAAPSLFSKMTGGGTITVANVLYDQLSLDNVQSKVTLDHGLVRLAPITAQVFGGLETGSILVDTRTTPTTYTVNSQLSKVDANKLLSSVSSAKQVLYGLLAANAKANFASTPGGEIARSLNGNVNLDLSNGRLMNVDLVQQLASIGRFLGYNREAQSFTNLVKLTGSFDIANGVASTNDLKAVLDVGSIAGDGSVNLVNQQLNMRLTAVLNKAFSSQVGGAGIGGMLNTALANSNGELVIPVLVGGTLQSPRVVPDAQKLAEMRLKNLLPTANNPAGMTSGILGAILQGQGGQQGGIGGVLGTITGQQQGQAQPQGQQQQQQPGIGGIVDVITGRQQQQQQPPKQQPPAQGQTQPAQPPKPPPPGNVFTDILNQVVGGTQQKQQKPAQQQQPPPPQQQQQPPEQPR